MRKKILFIVSNMETGGVSKSMTSLMNAIDRKRYDVSLLIVSPHGPLMELLPNDLQVVKNPIFEALTGRLDGFKKLIALGKPLLAISHLLRLAISMFCRWRGAVFMAKLAPGLTEEYDAIVDFNGQHQLYYMVDKLKAKRKITFFHNDYSKWDYYYRADKVYYQKVDAICTISDVCINALKKYFPDCSNKMYVIENISSPTFIRKLAAVPYNLPKTHGVILATLGHLCKRKGADFVVEAAKILKSNNVDFTWLHIGQIIETDFYNQIVNSELAEYFQFIGTTSNPYPYLNAADIIVHPSRFEGKSIALDEAKILCKPIVVTNFSTVHDQFRDGENASICEMNGSAVANAILSLIYHPEIAQKYTNNLSQYDLSNINEINKMYNLF